MENVVLTIHMILALLLIGIVLIQRSEGGGLGMGGGGGGAVSSRAAATALGKITWALAIGFIITSITLTILAASEAGSASVIDQLGGTVPAADPAAPPALDAGNLLPPTTSDAPAAPPAAPATPPASN